MTSELCTRLISVHGLVVLVDDVRLLVVAPHDVDLLHGQRLRIQLGSNKRCINLAKQRPGREKKLSKSSYLYLAAVLDALLLAEPHVGRALAGQREELDGRHLRRGGGEDEEGKEDELHSA